MSSKARHGLEIESHGHYPQFCPHLIGRQVFPFPKASHPAFGRIAALLLAGGATVQPADASTVIVPDDHVTVQSGIDSGADTVLVRTGVYPERPMVDRAVVLRGVGPGQRPRLEGLELRNTNFTSNPPLFSASGIAFSGPIHHATASYRPRLLRFSFSACSLDSGFNQLDYVDLYDIDSLSIRNCRLGWRTQAAGGYLFLEADTVDGGVAWDGSDVSIRNCWFRGGSSVAAVELTRAPSGTVAQNQIEGYRTGIRIPDVEAIEVGWNMIQRCGTGIELGWGWGPEVSNNEIQDCGVGILAGSTHQMHLHDNRILRSEEVGIWADGLIALMAERNVVAASSGAGMVLFQLKDNAIVRNNTIVANGGAAIELSKPFYPVVVGNNIGYGNRTWGLTASAGAVVQLGCNDWFGNGFGAVDGVGHDSTDLAVDPRFCDVDSADVRLSSSSGLVDAPGCGQIGAVGVGCGVTATLVQRFTVARVTKGILVLWKVAEGATAAEIWLERSDRSSVGPWARPVTERSVESGAVAELDRSAESGRAYWYRLLALEGSALVVIGAPIQVEAQPRLEFRLVGVGPSPGGGPVRIVFALRQAAAIEVDVFDIQGRRVASPGRGIWPAGTHAVVWDGRTRNGQKAPDGMYVVRYAHPGGQDRRAIVRVR